jgi:hypothetical protein
MKCKLRRFEVLLPARFNDGEEVPDDLLGEAVNEIIDQFNAVAWYKDAAVGYWQQGGKLFRDNLGLVVVDVPDTAKNRKWMKAYKARWKERLDQLEIWMVSYRIDVE